MTYAVRREQITRDILDHLDKLCMGRYRYFSQYEAHCVADLILQREAALREEIAKQQTIIELYAEASRAKGVTGQNEVAP